MFNSWSKKVTALILTVGFIAGVNQSYGQNRSSIRVIGTITQAQADSLTYMREEEKLARDVYLAMYEKWQTAVFSTIASSEQNHMDAVKRLLDMYGLVDPIQGTGVFTNSKLQALYNSLISRGHVSELEALKVGALIEETDIGDLQGYLSSLNPLLPNIQQVYQNLLAGSENHLRAFVRLIKLVETSYTAQYLPQETVDQILAATNQNQKGPGRRNYGQNGCQGRGLQGNCMNCKGCQPGQAFVDANGDGICDRIGSGIQTGKRNRGNNNSNGRNGRR